jgi:hypothetical protein
MLGKLTAVIGIVIGVAMLGCGGDACDTLDELCDSCDELDQAAERLDCEARREAALLAPVGAHEACQGVIDSGDFDDCGS